MCYTGGLDCDEKLVNDTGERPHRFDLPRGKTHVDWEPVLNYHVFFRARPGERSRQLAPYCFGDTDRDLAILSRRAEAARADAGSGSMIEANVSTTTTTDKS